MLRATWLERLCQRIASTTQPLKVVRLATSARSLRGHDAVIVAERTSSFLRTLRLVDGVFVHVPHGAGDREGGYDRRARHFDHHFVSGPKDAARFAARGLGDAQTIFVAGSLKLAGIARAFPAPARLFGDSRPVVLYNPHFEPGLSSYDALGLALLERFRADPNRNYIFAPHVRLRDRLSPSEQARITALARPNLRIDLGSSASCDMTYTRASDIYLGDVSSQVYEFLSAPRPCVFANPQRLEWDGDPAFSAWRQGDVAISLEGVMNALATAPERHSNYVARQREAFIDSVGENWENAPEAAAARIETILTQSG